MLKKLRWKFIGVSVSAIFIVLILLVMGINLFYNYITVEGMDGMIKLIASNEGSVPKIPPETHKKPKDIWHFNITKETPFETRYFTVWFDDNGNIVRSQMKYIASVNENNIDYYFQKALKSKKSFGYVENYRFYKCTDYDTAFFIFLDCRRQLQSIHSLLIVSILLTFIALSATFILVFLMSKRAINPTVKSIESQKQFITDASHEIKTPLTVITSYADVMCMEDKNNEWASGILKESHRLSALVSDLVLLSRWDEENPMSEKIKFSFSQAIWDILPPYVNIAKANGKKLEPDIDENLYYVGDESAIQTAISILLENAVKYSTPESIINIKAKVKRRTLILTVTNECIYKENLELNRLFDRFYRADVSHSRNTGGNGVGLSIAKAIIEAHHGKIDAYYENKEKITFRIQLP